MNRAFRAVAFSGAFVGAAYYAHKRTKLHQLGEQGFPTPLPEFEGGTTDEKLADTVGRYSRMAPVYDSVLDQVEGKYNGFDLRRNLLSQARGHVLEIGVGTARNLPYYHNDQVKSITFVDSTYPMLNAALVKMHDLYTIHNKSSVLITVDDKFDFEVSKARSFEELNNESVEFFKEKYNRIASGEDNIDDNDIISSLRSINTTTNNNNNNNNNSNGDNNTDDKIIHTTYRPQLLFPIDENTSQQLNSQATLKTNIATMLSVYPYPIKNLFIQHDDKVTIDNMDNCIEIEDEQSVGEKLWRVPQRPNIDSKHHNSANNNNNNTDNTSSVAELGSQCGCDNHHDHINTPNTNNNNVNKQDTVTTATIHDDATTTTTSATTNDNNDNSNVSSKQTISLSQPMPENVGAANRRQIEDYERAKREVAKKITKGQTWKTFTKNDNVIPSAFVHLDCHDLSFFPSNSYDTIVDTFGLCSFHHPVDVLREIRRICKPGGKILLLEHGLGTNFVINQVIRSTNDKHKKQWGCDRSKDIVELLREAGYDAQRVKRHHGGTTIVWDGSPQKTLLEMQEMNVLSQKQKQTNNEIVLNNTSVGDLQLYDGPQQSGAKF